MKRYVIIGGGPAGATAAEEIRNLDPGGKIIVVSNEDCVFYKRSQIIKLVSNSCIEDDLFTKGRDFFDKNVIDFRYGKVIKLIRDKKQIVLADKTIIKYDSLLIATGGSPITFPWDGVNLTGISTLYTLEDAKKVLKSAHNAKRAVIIGGGSTAMKVVQNFLKMGLDITIIEKSSHLWPVGFDRKISRIIERVMEKNGIKIYLNEEVERFDGQDGKVTSVILKNREEIQCDLVIITIGIKPNIDFLKDSGVIYDKGIIVDEFMNTNLPNIYAAGDVAQVHDPLYNDFILHPTWGNATRQGKIAANNMNGNQIKYKGTIPFQSMRVLKFSAIAAGISHSKENYDELSWVSFDKEVSRKFVLKNNKLIGALFLGKKINKKLLKPLLKKGILNKIDISKYKNQLLDEDFDLNLLLTE